MDVRDSRLSPCGGSEDPKNFATSSIIRDRSVRPLAPGDHAGGNGHVLGEENAEEVRVLFEPTRAGVAGPTVQQLMPLVAHRKLTYLCL